MPTAIERIADFAVSARFDDISVENLQLIKQVMLDTLACALGAVDAGLVARIAALPASHWPAGGAVTVIGGGTTSLHRAVCLNGAMVRYLDFLDVYWAREVCHPSENIPVALACAQAFGSSGRRLVEAIALAYELQIRMADKFSFHAFGLHHVSAAGFITPAMVGKLRGATAAQTARGVALGGARHLVHESLLKGQLSMAKAIGYGFAASDCLKTTELAMAGFTGPLTTLDDFLDGEPFFDATFPADPAQSLGKVSMKNYPIQFSLHAPAEASLALHARHGKKAIEKIDVTVTGLTAQRTADAAKFQPDSRETADHSLPCCVAMALADGSLTSEQFKRSRWQDEDVRSLMGRIQVHVDPVMEATHPADKPARVCLTFQDGSTDQCLVIKPLGTADNPFTWQQTEEKFRVLASPVLSPGVIDELIGLVQDLENVQDVGQLMRLLQTTNQ